MFTDRSNPNKSEGVARWLAFGAFCIMFPAYIAYQISVQKGVIHPYLGGYFSAGIAISLPLLLLAACIKPHSRIPPDLVEWLFVLFMLLFGMSLAVGVYFNVTPEILKPNAITWVSFVVLYLLGLLFPWGERTATLYAQFIFVGLLLLIVLNTAGGQLVGVGYIAPGADKELNYQAVALAYIVATLAALPPARVLIRYAGYILSIIALYLIGARSEFIAFVLIAGTIEFCMAKRKAQFVALGIVGIVVLLALAHAMLGTLPGSRILGLSDVSEDASSIARAALTSEAWLSISEAPFLGNYGSYLPGNYAHNILSAWVDMGLLGFVTLALLLTFAGASIMLTYRGQIRTPVFLVTAALLMANILLLLFAKYYTYQLLPIAIGAYANLRRRDAGYST
ncbi:O-antigen ligase family protein [Achromobacter xylosoxidans]|nr:O-antigen ligase family protein [Achromobacter xylosoxidans]